MTRPSRRLRSFWAAVGLCLLATTPLVADEGVAAVEEWLEAHVPAMMRDAKLPGFTIAVVRDGETIYEGAFGARDLEAALPATPDTLFGIGSVTKSFVAIAILQLQEAGKLSIDDPVAKHIPLELGLQDRPILIRHLLTHSPGFPNLATSTVLISRGLGRNTGVPMASADDFYRFVNAAEDEVLFPPGERYFYNNAAWRMLGHIVQEVSGVPFHRYLTEHVIRPLGMRRTTLDTSALFADADHLTPYRNGDEGPTPAKFPYPNPDDNPGFSFLAGAGGISSSAREMTAYVNMLIDGGSAAGGRRLLSPESMAQMQSLQIETGDGPHGREGYGFGLSVTESWLGHRRVGHGGSIAVSTAQMSFLPEARIGVVMMGNAAGMGYGRITDAVLAILLGKEPGAADAEAPVRARMERLAGTYETYRGLESIEVVERRGMLYLGGEEGRPLIPDDPTYASSSFHLLNGSRRTPVEFEERGDEMLLIFGRYVYHRR